MAATHSQARIVNQEANLGTPAGGVGEPQGCQLGAGERARAGETASTWAGPRERTNSALESNYQRGQSRTVRSDNTNSDRAGSQSPCKMGRVFFKAGNVF